MWARKLNNFKGADNSILLEGLFNDEQNLLFVNPVSEIICTKKDELEICFNQIEEALKKGYYIAGFFSYELGYLFEETFKYNDNNLTYPLIWMGVFESQTKTNASEKNINRPYYFSNPQLKIELNEYEENIIKIKRLISRGETYQINYTSEYNFSFFGDALSFYEKLKENQKSSYSAFIHYNKDFIISLSPELFFHVDRNGKIKVKPMKGTAQVNTPYNWLLQDQKSLSENVMIVDLLRNDLGRVCKSGTVKVDELFHVEEYSTLQQMTSTITGELKEDAKIIDIFKSLFPCGSVTGAPKIQSMKIIRSVEKQKRNIYTGAIGYFSPEGEIVFNVAIRTIQLESTSDVKYYGTMGVGSGIVFDSDAKNEYDECKLKAKFLFNSNMDFYLIETMLYTNKRIKYLSLHLRRLKLSAKYFSMPCDLNQIRSEIQNYLQSLKGNSRIRLLLNNDGAIRIEHQLFNLVKPERPIIKLSEIKTQSQDIFLYHKTSHRKLYNDEFKKYSERGFFDVIFRNERNEITEGAISNIFIKAGRQFYTPPLSCGLLNGIKRQLFIKKHGVKEKVLYLKDLERAEKIILTNSVRGVTEVRIEKFDNQL